MIHLRRSYLETILIQENDHDGHIYPPVVEHYIAWPILISFYNILAVLLHCFGKF